MEIKKFETGMDSLDNLIKEVLDLREFKKEIEKGGVVKINTDIGFGGFSTNVILNPITSSSQVILTKEDIKKEIDTYFDNSIQQYKIRTTQIENEIKDLEKKKEETKSKYLFDWGKRKINKGSIMNIKKCDMCGIEIEESMRTKLELDKTLELFGIDVKLGIHVPYSKDLCFSCSNKMERKIFVIMNEIMQAYNGDKKEVKNELVEDIDKKIEDWRNKEV